jgi:hypothetical protein
MTKNGHAPITALPYRAGVGVPPGVEVVDFRGLVDRAAGHHVDPYGLQRPEFHKLIAVRSGTLSHVSRPPSSRASPTPTGSSTTRRGSATACAP